MLQLVTTIQALRDLKNGARKLITIGVINYTPSNMLVAKGRCAYFYPTGHVYYSPFPKLLLNETYAPLKALNTNDAFRKRILALVCERMEEDFKAWTLVK